MPITNVATADYAVAGQPYRVSASDTVITDAPPSPGGGGGNAVLAFAQHGPGASGAVVVPVGQAQCGISNSGPFADVSPPVDLAGNSIVVPGPVDLAASVAFRTGDVLFVVLDDADADLDPGAVDSVLVRLTTTAGDAEVLALQETGAATGRFVGYLPIVTAAVTSYDCSISGGGVDITATYTDAGDPSDAVSAVAFVDPLGLVFDAASGTPVNGAEVTIVDAVTGLPALVLGQDAVSSYPATVTSGGQASDNSGVLYEFGDGEYRFPHLAPGQYRLEVIPPNRFAFPSGAADGTLQQLPGAPFALSGASRGQSFPLPVGPAVRVDIPLDLLPLGSTGSALTLSRSDPGGEAGYVGATQCLVGQVHQAAQPPVSGGNPLPVPGEISLSGTAMLGTGEAFFVRVVDPDQDQDPFAPDSVAVEAVTGDDAESLLLTETGASTGVFVGYLQTDGDDGTVNNCALSVRRGGLVTVSYVDPSDEGDTASAELMVDPGGRVFDAATGNPIDGARVTLVNVATGRPAEGNVFDEDGVTPHPASVMSGQAGVAGGYRFPVITPGNYQLTVEPPLGFSYPSAVPDAELDLLPGAPFNLAPGSRGGEIRLLRGDALTLDIPLDVLDVELFVVKRSSKAQAAIGDFVQFQVSVENATQGGVAAALAVVDRLPKGFRYAPGSARVNGGPLDDPDIRSDGRTLRFAPGDLGAGGQVTVSYVTEITSGAELGDAVNLAQATATGQGGAVEGVALTSNEAFATVTIREELLFSKATIIGDVTAGACGEPGASVPGVRVFLEDGTYVVTDASGKYHFEGVEPGTHVVQVDTGSIPPGLEPATCTQNARRAGSRLSQFVELAGGTLWRADFRMVEKAPRVEQVAATFAAQGSHAGATFEYVLTGGAVAAEEVTVVLTLPDTAEPGGVLVDGGPAPAASIDAGAVTVRLGDLAGPFSHRISVAATAETGTAFVARATTLFKTADEKRRRLPVQSAVVGTSAQPAESGVAVVDVVASGRLEVRSPVAIPPLPDSKTPIFSAVTVADGEVRAIVWPEVGYNPRIAATGVVVKHAPRERTRLTVNGEMVNPLAYEGTDVNRQLGVALSRYRNVPLTPGPNRLEVWVSDAEGGEERRLVRDVHFAGAPVRAELVPEESYLVADGVTPPVVAIRFFDRHGKPVRPGMTGPLVIQAPYRVFDDTRELEVADHTHIGAKYLVRRDGVAYVQLEPTLEAGRLTLAVALTSSREKVLRSRLVPAAREWILVGFAEGTVGYNTLSGNMQALDDANVDEDAYTDGRAAFYAKGQIRGGWLATVAYDTDKRRDQGRLGQQIDPNRFYTLYGDGTEQRYDAQSQRKLYLKLERADFMAMFGDFDTGLDTTEFTRYSRTFNGVKTEYTGGRWRATGFGAETDQAFIRDDIRGDGTSGEYRLSRTPAVINSESIRIEVRDRFRSEVVLASQPLTRYLDYTIDYDAGTLIFKRPVPSQDESFNPIYIVAEYEVNSLGGGEDIIAGGRLGYAFGPGESEVAATVVADGTEGDDGELVGLDAKWEFSEVDTIDVEWAHTDTDRSGDANAYLAQLTHESGDATARAYYRKQQAGFGLGQQTTTEAGTRKYGVESDVRMTEEMRLRLQAFNQSNLASNTDRQVAESQLEFHRSDLRLTGGVRTVREQVEAQENLNGTQVLLGASRTMAEGRVKLRADAEIDVDSEEAQNTDYPTRLLLGGEYLVRSGVSLIAEQELTWGLNRDTRDTRVGVKAQPWSGADIASTLTREHGENGERLFATTGLLQQWQVNEHWFTDFGVDRTHTIENTPAAFDPAALLSNARVPPASGSVGDDFTAVFVSAGYRRDRWDGNARIEFHDGEMADKWNYLAGFSHQLEDGKVISASFALLMDTQSSGAERNQGDFRLGLAWRPSGSHWAVLNRLDFVFDALRDDAFDTKTRKLVHNMGVNYQPDARNQLSVSLGSKYVVDQFDGENYDGVTGLLGFEYRFDVSERYDVGMRGAVLHSFESNVLRHSSGLSFGVTPYHNFWISLGYNFTGFEDGDFAGADYTAKGPYLKFRMKVDQESFADFLEYASVRR